MGNERLENKKLTEFLEILNSGLDENLIKKKTREIGASIQDKTRKEIANMYKIKQLEL